jgi:hypothetical protein
MTGWLLKITLLRELDAEQNAVLFVSQPSMPVLSFFDGFLRW